MREPIPPMDDIVVRSTRDALAAIEYTGPDSVREAKTLGDRLALMAEAVRRSDADDETKAAALLEARLSGREVDRKLGQMLAEGREAGDIRQHGDQSKVDSHDLASLADLGISKDRAADASAFAYLPDAAWARLMEEAREKRNASRSAVASATRRLIAEMKGLHETARQRAEAEKERHARSLTEIAELEKAELVPDIPPLTDAELTIAGAGMELRAAVGAEEDIIAARETDPLSAGMNDPEARAHQALLKQMSALTASVRDHHPHLFPEPARIIRLYAARDSVKRLTNELTTWMRTLNELYETGRNNDD